MDHGTEYGVFHIIMVTQFRGYVSLVAGSVPTMVSCNLTAIFYRTGQLKEDEQSQLLQNGPLVNWYCTI